MAEGVLGLGSGQAASLNQELIDKLKTAERASTVVPLETQLTDMVTEKETLDTIISKANELLDTVKPFDLFTKVGTVTAFDQKSATTTGTSVVFDALDAGALNTGETTVDVSQLAKRDVFQTATFSSKTDVVSTTASSKITITHDGEAFDFTVKDKTYEDLASEINNNLAFNATVEEVGTGSFRIVIKSAESGEDNALTMGQANVDIGLGNALNHTLTAVNMKAKIDGVDYEAATNIVTIEGGLKITALEIGESTINVNKDTSAISTGLEDFATKYNELIALIDNELFSADSKIDDKSTLRNVVNAIKDKLFGSYGENGELSIFNFGLNIDENGLLNVDTAKVSDSIENDYENFKMLLIGTAANEGLGTQLKTVVDSLDGFEGMFTSYETAMSTRETSLEEQKEKAIESLDNKYKQLAAQFASYGTIINQFESSFNGLKLFIEQSTAS